MRVVVGSRSQYKIDATHDAMQLLFPDTSGEHEVVGVSVDSGVSSQPMSNEESIRGARNRSLAAMQLVDATYGIGIENGLTQVEGIWFANTWIVATDTDGREGMASTILRPVPPQLIVRIHDGAELSDAVRDGIPHEVREKHSGLIGIITNGVLNRHDVLRDGIVVAMSSLLQPDLYRS